MVDAAFARAATGAAVARVAPLRVQALWTRGLPPAKVAAIGRVAGLSLPLDPNRASGRAPRALWLAPGEWMIVGGSAENLALAGAAGDTGLVHAADVGEGRAIYAVSGERSRDLLAKGCTLDLHPRVFGVDRCGQTALAQCFVIIDQMAESTFHVHADASYAHHLELWFVDALIEFGGAR